jgi:hypothetical protein
MIVGGKWGGEKVWDLGGIRGGGLEFAVGGVVGHGGRKWPVKGEADRDFFELTNRGYQRVK